MSPKASKKGKASQPPAEQEKKSAKQANKSGQAEDIINVPVPRKQLIAAKFSGPIPPPDILHQYEQILPGSADRIISMAEGESKHRRAMEERVVEYSFENEKLGLNLGFRIGVVALLVSGVVAIFGHASTGLWMALASIGAMVSSFLYGSHQKKAGQEEIPEEKAS